ncbi:MAG: CDP-alcohol phosphatidyltransferase family protein [Rhodothermaceae bacterium]
MQYKFKDINTVSNYISLLRVFLAFPLFIFVDKFEVSYSYRLMAFGMCILAYITDVLDGYLARKLDQISEFGKIIDPLADKLCIILIVFKLYFAGHIPDYYFYIIVLRDVIIFTGGIFVTKKIGFVLPSNILGKAAVVSIGFFIIGVILGADAVPSIYNILLYLSILMSFASVIGYAYRGIEAIKWKKNETIQES